jgi:hypothetical protein
MHRRHAEMDAVSKLKSSEKCKKVNVVEWVYLKKVLNIYKLLLSSYIYLCMYRR